jgi:hypothetical protein
MNLVKWDMGHGFFSLLLISLDKVVNQNQEICGYESQDRLNGASTLKWS